MGFLSTRTWGSIAQDLVQYLSLRVLSCCKKGLIALKTVIRRCMFNTFVLNDILSDLNCYTNG